MWQVVTKRTKNLKKQEIPSLDDPISKLNHIGKETVKKLNELKAAADEASVDLPIPQALWRCAAASVALWSNKGLEDFWRLISGFEEAMGHCSSIERLEDS